MHDELDHPIELICPNCGYNVAIIPGNRCPECGAVFDRAALRRNRGLDDQGPQLWRPVTVILCVPIACASVMVLSNYAVGMFAGIFAGPMLAIICVACLAATLAVSERLVNACHAREIGVGLSRRQIKRVAVILGLVAQAVILAGAVWLARQAARL